MSTFLFASIPVPAHTTNPIPFAQRLIERGHRVLWYSGRVFHERLAAIGAEPVPYVQAEDFGGVDLETHFPEFRGLEGARAIKTAFARVFVGEAAGRVADLRAVLAAQPPDQPVEAMLCDGLMYGVGMTHELGGPAWATFGDGPLPWFEPDTPPFGPGLDPMRGPVGRLRNRVVSQVARHVLFADAARRHAQIRADLGLPAGGDVLEASTSPYLHLQGCTPGFEYPRTSVPPHMHWVGALRADPPTDWRPPAWWPRVVESARPVVLVSQGSIRPDMTELVLPTLQALADRDVLVVVTTGQTSPTEVETAWGATLPANVLCTSFAPYDRLLPHVDCFVTNGGYTGVTLALAHGVPLVQAGRTEEKAEIAARIRFTGVGVRLGTTRPSPDAVERAVDRVLGEPAFAAAAQRVQAEMAEHDAGREGADLLERLATTQRPVLRHEAAPSAAGG